MPNIILYKKWWIPVLRCEKEFIDTYKLELEAKGHKTKVEKTNIIRNEIRLYDLYRKVTDKDKNDEIFWGWLNGKNLRTRKTKPIEYID